MLQNRSPNLAQPQAGPMMQPGQPVAPPAQRGGFLRHLKHWWQVVPLFALGLFVAEHYAPEQYKPSTITGGFVGHEEAIRLRTELEAAKARIAAQNEENARMQQEIELFRARTERVTEAYKVLFTRANMMSQAIAQVQQQYMVMRQQMVKEIQGVNVGMAQTGDLTKIMGALFDNQKLKEIGNQFSETGRANALNEFDESMRQGLSKSASIFSNWQSGVPDITQIDQMVRADRVAPLQPGPRAAPPPPPPAYQTPATSPAPTYQTANIAPGITPAVLPASTQASAPAAPIVNRAEAEGAAAWNEWKAWEDAHTGNRRAGLDWWAANRNVPRHATCAEGARRSSNDEAARREFEAGCLAAKERLDPLDARRNAAYDFNKGFNVAAGGSPPPMLTNEQKQWCKDHGLVIIACNSRFKQH